MTGNGSGLRVKSPDDHVILLILLYLTGVFSLFFSSLSGVQPGTHWPLEV